MLTSIEKISVSSSELFTDRKPLLISVSWKWSMSNIAETYEKKKDLWVKRKKIFEHLQAIAKADYRIQPSSRFLLPTFGIQNHLDRTK